MTQRPMHFSLLYRTADERTIQIIKSKSWLATGNHFCCKVLPYLSCLGPSQSRSLSMHLPVREKGKGKEELLSAQLQARSRGRRVAHVHHHISALDRALLIYIYILLWSKETCFFFSSVN